MSNQLGKPEETMCIKVYHGSSQIVEQPICKYGRTRLDFGPGFYLTDIRDQAERWAEQMEERSGAKPFINIYQLDKERFIKNYRSKIFNAYDREWLHFIVDCRRGYDSSEDYDYIEGGVANDRVIDTVNLYMQGYYSEEYALRRLSDHQPNNQICLLHQHATDQLLHFEKAIDLSIVQDILMSGRIGIIAAEIAKRSNITPIQALKLFYESETCRQLHDKRTGLYLLGDMSIVEEFLRSSTAEQIERQ